MALDGPADDFGVVVPEPRNHDRSDIVNVPTKKILFLYVKYYQVTPNVSQICKSVDLKSKW